ncbi:DUF4314 domain-containing protein [Dactylosporangium sp. NPDC048998]|uniref:DUF4314 domain-containing protein n=1 Tax=Dactylosporangium sp. NPDC048998 TaxID=3363976 RepID=UPI00372461B8
MQFEAGQRVALIRTTDPHTDLRPGDQGTVRGVDRDQRRVDVAWDRGSTLSMLLDAGDELTTVPATAAVAANPTGPSRSAGAGAAVAWPDLLTALCAVRAVGAADGADAAEWWVQDTLGGRASGDTAATARRILTGIDDGDPAILDTLPGTNAGWAASGAARYHGTTGAVHAETAAALTGEQWQQAEAAYLEGFDTAVTDAIAAACRRTLHPTGDDRDLAHLHPDRVTLGSVGVFSGDWNDAGAGAAFPLTAGYVGTLIDRWNGWAVFTCTRAVAEAIVADQQQARETYRGGLAQAGVPETDLDRQTDETYPRMWWDGDVIVVDSTTMYADPEAVERIEPRQDGGYVVMGGSWCWQAVDPYDCARIAGDLPEPGQQQEWILLTHTPYTVVPPAPYTIDRLVDLGTGRGYTAELRHAGAPAAIAVGVAAPTGAAPPARLAATNGRFDADDWRSYVAAARRCGEPMTEAAVLDALTEDALLDAATAEAVAAGATLVRLLDDTGGILALHRFSVAASSPQAFGVLCAHVRGVKPDPRGFSWQYFNGRVWRHLMPAAATEPFPPAAPGIEPAPGN